MLIKLESKELTLEHWFLLLAINFGKENLLKAHLKEENLIEGNNNRVIVKVYQNLWRKGFIEPNDKVRGMEKGAHYEFPEKPRSVNFRLNWDYKQRENDFQYETIENRIIVR